MRHVERRHRFPTIRDLVRFHTQIIFVSEMQVSYLGILRY